MNVLVQFNLNGLIWCDLPQVEEKFEYILSANLK